MTAVVRTKTGNERLRGWWFESTTVDREHPSLSICPMVIKHDCLRSPPPERRPPASSSCRRCWLGPGHCPSRRAFGGIRAGPGVEPGPRKDQPDIDQRAVVVEGEADTVRVVPWQRPLGAPFLGLFCCDKTIIPDAQEHPLASSVCRPDAFLRWIWV